MVDSLLTLAANEVLYKWRNEQMDMVDCLQEVKVPPDVIRKMVRLAENGSVCDNCGFLVEKLKATCFADGKTYCHFCYKAHHKHSRCGLCRAFFCWNCSGCTRRSRPFSGLDGFWQCPVCYLWIHTACCYQNIVRRRHHERYMCRGCYCASDLP